MDSFILDAEPPIGFEKREFPNLQLIEVMNLSIVSISFSNTIFPKFKKLALKNLNMKIPNVGESRFCESKNIKLIALQQDQIFAVFERKSNYPINEIKSIFGDECYYSDQSDSWSLTLNCPSSVFLKVVVMSYFNVSSCRFIPPKAVIKMFSTDASMI